MPVRPVFLPVCLALLVGVSFGAGCMKKGPLPDGDDLESQGYGEGPEARLPASPMPPDEAALSAAFDPPPEVEDTTTEPLPEPATVAPERPGVESHVRAGLQEAKRAVSAGQWEKASEALASHAPNGASPGLQQEHAELSMAVALGQKDKPRAQKSAEKWLLACGPQKIDSCRQRALSGMKKSGVAPARIAKLRAADVCTQKLEAQSRSAGKGAPVPGCVKEAAALYSRMSDGLMTQRLKFAKALVQANASGAPDSAIPSLEAVEKNCDGARCSDLRQRALRTISRLHAENGHATEAARAALREMELLSRGLSPTEQLYARTELVDKRCAKLDANEGEGTCRKLERGMFGRYSFRDFSKGKPQSGLPVEVIREVNSHYGVLVQDCLLAQASRQTATQSQTYEVRWSVTTAGGVTNVRIADAAQDASPFGKCLREQFTVWRYPRYRGEQQHLEQSFGVSSRQRTTR